MRDFDDANPWRSKNPTRGFIKPEDLVSGMKSPTITLVVGNEEEIFSVHKDYLCAVDFFKKALCGNFREAAEGVIELPEERPSVIKLFLEWLMTGFQFDNGDVEVCYARLCKWWCDDTSSEDITGLITLADKWCLNDLLENIYGIMYEGALDTAEHGSAHELLTSWQGFRSSKARFIMINAFFSHRDNAMHPQDRKELLGESLGPQLWVEITGYREVLGVALEFQDEEAAPGTCWGIICQARQSGLLLKAIVEGRALPGLWPRKQFEHIIDEKKVDEKCWEWTSVLLGL